MAEVIISSHLSERIEEMANIIGFYTTNICALGNPYQLGYSTETDAYNQPITRLAVGDDKGHTIFISPPFDLSETDNTPETLDNTPEISSCNNESVGTGFYYLDNGILRSVYFPEATANPSPEYPSSYITPLINGGIEDIQAGTHPVTELHWRSPFSEERDDQYFTGLAQCVRIKENNSPPIYVIDSHTMAYYSWHEALALGETGMGAVLINIDRHIDDRVPDEWQNSCRLADAAEYTRQILDESNFILPAIQEGLIDEFWYFNINPEADLGLSSKGTLEWRSEDVRPYSIDEFKKRRRSNTTPSAERTDSEQSLSDVLGRLRSENKRIILDIDLDAFVRQGFEYENNDIPTRQHFLPLACFIAGISSQVDLITIATSPLYADQNIAIPLAQQIAEAITNGCPVLSPIPQNALQ